MFSKILRPRATAAWRLSLWTTIAFAVGSALAFGICYHMVSLGIRERSDQWLHGEAAVLTEVSQTTPQGDLYDRLVEEVAENASREVPHGDSSRGEGSVFFLQVRSGESPLWVGPPNREEFQRAIQAAQLEPGAPRSIQIAGFSTPYRVVARRLSPEGLIYLGFSDYSAVQLLGRLTRGFFIVWIGTVVLGFMISYVSTRKTLMRVENITQTVSKIGSDDFRARLPDSADHDEIARLSQTFNRMLDRIQSSVDQLRNVTDSVAHDLKSPVTSIRGRLEGALLEEERGDWRDSVAEAVEDLDRLLQFINTTLDLAEAQAGALRLRRSIVDFVEVVEQFAQIYQPAMSERQLELSVLAVPPVMVDVDLTLMQRILTNLLDNEMTHVPPGHKIELVVRSKDDRAEMLVQDDGPGFSPGIRTRVLERFVKGEQSRGHGLGLAFVDAVVQAHGGTVSIEDRTGGGACIHINLPLAPVPVA